jgi:hypothetical protein
MKVSNVTELPPTKSRMDPKFGMDSAMKRRTSIVEVRNAIRFQLISVKDSLLN